MLTLVGLAAVAVGLVYVYKHYKDKVDALEAKVEAFLGLADPKDPPAA